MKLKILKKAGRFFVRVSIVGTLTLLLFELCFRLYVIDFYKYSFDVLNEDLTERNVDKELMLIGDSFSAVKDGYAQVLYDSLPDYNIRNISVQGTSIREQFLFGRYHIKRRDPDVLIFQYYVGNDLFGWRHPSNWSDISVARNVYWQASHSLWSLAYLNARLGYLKTIGVGYKPVDATDPVFSPENFTLRDRIYFQTEPALVENSAYLKEGRDEDLEEYLVRMKDLFSYVSPDTKIYILVIPHAAQVSDIYLDRMEKIGGVFTKEFQVGQESYPLFDNMKDYFLIDDRVEILNPLSFLSEQEIKGEPIYYTHDTHLNHQGQALLGHYLNKELKRGMVSSD